MRTYKVIGLTSDAGGVRLAKAVRNRVDSDVFVSVDVAGGKMRVGNAADPMNVRAVVEGAGYRVERVDEDYLI